MKRITAKLIVSLLVGGVWFLILVYIADFSQRQSVVLALILMWVGHYVGEEVKKLNERTEKIAEKPAYKFVPYHIRIDPQWQQLLIDFKLIGSAEEWAQIKETLSQRPRLPIAAQLRRDRPPPQGGR